MNHRSFRNLKDIIYGDRKKSEFPKIQMFLEVIVSVSADQDGPFLEASKTLKRGNAVTFGVAPFFVPVEMIVSNDRE